MVSLKTYYQLFHIKLMMMRKFLLLCWHVFVSSTIVYVYVCVFKWEKILRTQIQRVLFSAGWLIRMVGAKKFFAILRSKSKNYRSNEQFIYL